jgi:hypothetical protein
MDVGASDFDLMWEIAMAWGPDWAAHDGRFLDIHKGSTEMPPYDLRMAYWFGHRWVEVLLAQMFLDNMKIRYRTVWDSGLHPSGEEMGFIIVTDYVAQNMLRLEEA